MFWITPTRHPESPGWLILRVDRAWFSDIREWVDEWKQLYARRENLRDIAVAIDDRQGEDFGFYEPATILTSAWEQAAECKVTERSNPNDFTTSLGVRVLPVTMDPRVGAIRAARIYAHSHQLLIRFHAGKAHPDIMFSTVTGSPASLCHSERFPLALIEPATLDTIGA